MGYRGKGIGSPLSGSSSTSIGISKTASSGSGCSTSRGGPSKTTPAIAHADHALHEAPRKGEIVDDGDDRHPLGVEPVEECHHLDLMLHVEEARRLVQEQNAGLLGEGKRDPGALPLPPRKACQRPLGKRLEVGRVERPGDRLVVGGRCPLQESLVGVAPPPDEFAHS